MILIQISKFHLSYNKQIYKYQKSFKSIKIKVLLTKQNFQLLIINIVIVVLMTMMVKYFLLKNFFNYIISHLNQTQKAGYSVFGIYNFKLKIKNKLESIDLFYDKSLDSNSALNKRNQLLITQFFNALKSFFVIALLHYQVNQSQKYFNIIYKSEDLSNIQLFISKQDFILLFIYSQSVLIVSDTNQDILLLKEIQLKLKSQNDFRCIFPKLYLQQNKNENKSVLYYIISYLIMIQIMPSQFEHEFIRSQCFMGDCRLQIISRRKQQLFNRQVVSLIIFLNNFNNKNAIYILIISSLSLK
ncbi:unnamed protein product [Paramecium pentaurelia]|uniref:Transmembrane protein n=1 Tax=Paramecium pentaurelia TaxID=43138 RepID=A0A8S1UPC1_9CILI|nr:unnamed protein product [Paramecium pentaurelia]